jgi:hypothetical protein
MSAFFGGGVRYAIAASAVAADTVAGGVAAIATGRGEGCGCTAGVAVTSTDDDVVVASASGTVFSVGMADLSVDVDFA